MRDDLLARIASFQADNDALRDEVAYLKSLLVPPWVLPEAWRLTPTEEAILLCLISRPSASREALVAACAYYHVSKAGEDPAIPVYLSRLRRRLGVKIRGRWGRGWAMDEADRARLRAQVAGLDGNSSRRPS